MVKKNRYVQGHRLAKMAVGLWWIFVVVITLVAKFKLPAIFDPLTMTESPVHSFWWLLVMALTFILMWLAGGYFLYLGGISIRYGVLLPDSAIYPLNTKHHKGLIAYIVGIVFLVLAASFFSIPIILNFMAKQEISRTLQLHQKLVEGGILPQDR